ncbi:hypothetical protein Tco_0115278 [Tanacetum coccineum]
MPVIHVVRRLALGGLGDKGREALADRTALPTWKESITASVIVNKSGRRRNEWSVRGALGNLSKGQDRGSVGETVIGSERPWGSGQCGKKLREGGGEGVNRRENNMGTGIHRDTYINSGEGGGVGVGGRAKHAGEEGKGNGGEE